MVRRLQVLVGSIVVACAWGAPAVAAAPTPSPSAPPIVDFVEISGDALATPIVLSSDKHAQRQDVMRREVKWLIDKTPVTGPPPPEQLGPKYTVVLLTMGQATDRFEVYPMAVGGPRVFRPADQPGRQVAEGWFYGRLSLPTSLLAAGVPLEGVTPEPGMGGQGGGLPASQPPDVGAMIGDWSRFMGLNVAAIIIIASGVFGLAYVVRRRI
ncbi:hypothetical protein [Allorhizocola rhizosphaerae]|uniref:hypothetical protein n=1 Tax=Allorhizocola rhizosphaerae TaxID=1872709 RepID=UPI000E3D0AA6|nr:hypothetical protein [Allorhizocola rhizosphaerae]